MIVYGRNAVRELLRARRRPVDEIWATERAAAEPWLGDAPVTPADAATIEARCESREHQGVCAQAGPYPYVAAHGLLDSPDALVLALDEVQDPHNLGAVCRVAESAGAAGVVIPERRSAQVTPAVCKASAGAVEHLQIARVANLADWLGEAKGREGWVYGAAAVPDAVSYTAPDWSGRVVLVLGSEGRGLRARVAGACDALVALPQRGQVGSLNVSAAAAALVYGILQSREQGVDRAT